MKSDFLIALTQLAAERSLPKEMVLSAIEAALASAYKKDNVAAGQNIAVRLNPATGDIRVFVLMKVVESVEDDRKEMTLAEARKQKRDAAIDDIIETESNLHMAGRIAAQTAKQVVMQRLREAERELVFAEYASRADDVVTGTIQRTEGRDTIVDLGKTEAVLPEREQVPTERYRPGQKVKVYIVEVDKNARGPQIMVSRSHRNLLRRLFEIEVPEISKGIVEIKAIAREAGSRSKVAVWARQEGVDAVGSCVGLRGIRIQNIVNELMGEKIDVVQWHRDFGVFIASALNPAQAIHVELNEAEKVATVVVQEKMLSLAIGRDGQNARLAAKLTGWKIDILSSTEAEVVRRGRPAPVAAAAVVAPAPLQAPVAATKVAATIAAAARTQAVPAASQRVPEKELVAAGAKIAAEPSPLPKVPEEELAELAIQEAQQAPEEEEEAIPITEDVWKVPILTLVGGPQIRFAEDIMPGRGREGPRRGGRRGRNDGEETGKVRRAAERRRKGEAGGQPAGDQPVEE
ncbi:MAG: transcription termination factor NusA [Dehalococcoidia bacterium]|nr:transcription termination factor NusA [Dehalococcoidia bacterium]